jgi:hypothetical protein
VSWKQVTSGILVGCFFFKSVTHPSLLAERSVCSSLDRNNDVVFLYSPGAAGLPFVSGPEKDQIDGSVPDLSKMQGAGSRLWPL